MKPRNNTVKRVFITLLSLSVIMLSSFVSLNSHGNPIPIYNYGTNPTIFSNTSIRFKSEQITYVMTEDPSFTEVFSSIYINYSFENPTSSFQNITIYLPFNKFTPTNLNISHVGTNIEYVESDLNIPSFENYRCVRLDLHFNQHETTNIYVTYSEAELGDNSIRLEKPISFFTKLYGCSYIAETGQYWNNTLESATFQFFIPKSTYSFGLDGFQKNETNDYIIATKSYSNWSSNTNIGVTWHKIDYFKSFFTISIIIIPIAVLIWIVIRYYKRKWKT